VSVYIGESRSLSGTTSKNFADSPVAPSPASINVCDIAQMVGTRKRITGTSVFNDIFACLLAGELEEEGERGFALEEGANISAALLRSDTHGERASSHELSLLGRALR